MLLLSGTNGYLSELDAATVAEKGYRKGRLRKISEKVLTMDTTIMLKPINSNPRSYATDDTISRN